MESNLSEFLIQIVWNTELHTLEGRTGLAYFVWYSHFVHGVKSQYQYCAMPHCCQAA